MGGECAGEDDNEGVARPLKLFLGLPEGVDTGLRGAGVRVGGGGAGMCAEIIPFISANSVSRSSCKKKKLRLN